MKALVIYDSQFGNTKKIAETVAGVIDAQIVYVTDFDPAVLAEMDLIVVGTPIHGWRPSEDTSKFLTQLEKSELEGKYVAAFDTGFSSMFSGNAAAKIIKALQKAGGKSLIPTHKFTVEHSEGPLGPEEVDRASQWAQELRAKYEAVAGHAPVAF